MELEKNVSLEWKLPGSRQSENDNMAKMLDHKVWDLNLHEKQKDAPSPKLHNFCPKKKGKRVK